MNNKVGCNLQSREAFSTFKALMGLLLGVRVRVSCEVLLAGEATSALSAAKLLHCGGLSLCYASEEILSPCTMLIEGKL